jgi:hypothetical protein
MALRGLTGQRAGRLAPPSYLCHQQWSPVLHVYVRRPVLVVADLVYLRGPVSGTVELPLWLFWSGASPAAGGFNLDELVQRRSMSVIVLREACKATDLTSFLDRETLVSMWPEVSRRLRLQVRAAWGDQHQCLRAVGRSRADVLRTAD